jgi:hypothetical protein
MRDRPQPRLSRPYRCFDRRKIANIDPYAAHILDTGSYVPHRDSASLPGQSLCARQADAARPARDHRYMTL